MTSVLARARPPAEPARAEPRGLAGTARSGRVRLTAGLLRLSTALSGNKHAYLAHVAGRLLGLPHVGQYFAGYAYGRWVDTCLDRGGLDPAGGLAFLARQDDVVRGRAPPRCPEERLGRCTGEFLAGPGASVSPAWDELWRGLRFQVERRGRVLGEAELRAHARRFGGAALALYARALGRRRPLPPELAGLAGWVYVQVDALLDIDEDLPAGTINLPREALARHRIPEDVVRAGHPGALRAHPGTSAWILEEVALLDAAAGRLGPAARRLDPWPVRAFFGWMLRRRRARLAQLRSACAAPPTGAP